jgi:glutathione S-transferase
VADLVLWHIPISHYNEKARWALDFKRLQYELRAPTPGLHRLTALALTRGKHQRLPILRIDGRRVADSTAIIATLETADPDPPLYPSDAAEREHALALEDYFDEELAPRVRRVVWHHTFADNDATIDAVFPDAGRVLRGLMRVTAPVAKAATRRDYSVSEATAAEALEGINAVFDRIEDELDGGEYLVGDRFSVADLTAAALATPLIAPPERPYAPEIVPSLRPIRAELESRPAGAWVTEMYARHRGSPVAVAAV